MVFIVKAMRFWYLNPMDTSLIVDGATLARINHTPYCFFSLLKNRQAELVREIAALLVGAGLEHIIFNDLPGPVEPEIVYAMPHGQILNVAKIASPELRKEITDWSYVTATEAPPGIERVPTEWGFSLSKHLTRWDGETLTVINCQTHVTAIVKRDHGKISVAPLEAADWLFWSIVDGTW